MKLISSTTKNKIFAMMYRQYIPYARHLDRKMDTLFWPTLDAVLFGAIGTFAQRNGSSSGIAIMLTGFLMAQIVWQSHLSMCKVFVQEVWDRNVLYALTRPIRGRDFLTASILTTIVVASIAIGLVAITISVMFHLGSMNVSYWLALFIPVLMLTGWSTALFAISIVVRMGQKGDNFIWALFGLIGPLSGSIVPVEYLPAGIKHFAMLLPMTHAYECGRRLIFNNGPVGVELALAVGGAITMFIAGCWVLSRSMTTFRQRGYVAKYV